jgi:MFS family permease
MQNVVLPAYVYARTDSASILAAFVFAQLGPLLLLSVPGGVMADRVDRRTWLLSAQVVQLSCSVLLGVFTALDSALLFLFLAQLGVGVGNALNAPAFSAVMPSLVPPADLGGSISLSSVSVNGSRVVGPVIVAVIMSWGVTPAQVFFLNAATYLIVVRTIARVPLPPNSERKESGWRSFSLGFRTAKERPVIGRILLSMTTFSLVSLPFVGLFAAVAAKNFDIQPSTSTYKWLYATWGLGAMFGALSVGTVLASMDKRRTAQWGFVAFAATMTLFAFASSAVPAFVTGFFLGASYFATTTSLLTVLQGRLELEIRARVLALWFMAFGGTVPLGNLIFGPVMDAVGARPVLLLGAAWALVLAWWCDIVRIDTRTAGTVPLP